MSFQCFYCCGLGTGGDWCLLATAKLVLPMADVSSQNWGLKRALKPLFKLFLMVI